MNKLILIFDYFKEAFHINKQNKSLYKPQIALIAVDVLLILFVGIGVYNWVDMENIRVLTEIEPREILGFALSYGFKLLAIMLVYALISVLVESGLLNMYKKAVTQGHTEAADFKEGISKYFLKLLFGKVLIFLCYIPALQKGISCPWQYCKSYIGPLLKGLSAEAAREASTSAFLIPAA